MQSFNRLHSILRSGATKAYGSWIMLPGANLARTVARCGFDWICVDTEHGNIDDAAMHESVAAIGACGVSPVVRVAANEAWMIKRVLDAGAHGVMVPWINTAEDARKAVSASKFPPQGIRGFGSPFSMQTFGDIGPVEYLQQSNESILTILQIESKEGLANVSGSISIPNGCVMWEHC